MSEHARKRARAVLRGRDSGNIILLLDNLTGIDPGKPDPSNYGHRGDLYATVSVLMSEAERNGANLRGANLSDDSPIKIRSSHK